MTKPITVVSGCEYAHAQPKPCERCGAQPATPGWRFCPACHAIVCHELRTSGYLTPLPPRAARRPLEAMEDPYATKYGPCQ